MHVSRIEGNQNGEQPPRRRTIPRAGQTLSAAAELRAVHFRNAVKTLERAFQTRDKEFLKIFEPRWRTSAAGGIEESFQNRAAWALVNTWTLAHLAGAGSPQLDFAEAETWFFGRHKQFLCLFSGPLAPRPKTAIIPGS